MTTLAALWLPILLSAVFVFLVSSVLHMVVPLHKSDYKKLPDEEGALEALRKTGAPPGQYMFPCPASMKDCSSPEMKAKFARGPVGMMVLRPPGPMGMGKPLGQWFVFCLVIGLFVAYATGIALSPGAAGMQVFRVASVAAVLAHAFSCVNDSIWKGVSWSVSAKFAFDGLLYGVTTGATFAWLWPTA